MYDDGGGGCLSCRAPRKDAASDIRPTAWVQELTASCRTGDIVLFSSKHSSSNITKFFTNSVWDHVGVVVRPSPNRAYLVEWGSGLFATELVERLTEYHECDSRQIVVRNLKLAQHRERIEDLMEGFLDMLFREELGRNRVIPVGQVTRAARRQMFRFGSVSREEHADVVVDDLTQLFCSKAVAAAYKSVGLISARRDASDFLPKHFAHAHSTFLDLQLGASLGPERQITFESAAMREAVSTFHKVVGLDFLAGTSAKLHAAQTMQRAARRLVARRETQRRRSSVTAASPYSSASRTPPPRRLVSRTVTSELLLYASPPSVASPIVSPASERGRLLKEVSRGYRPRAESVYKLLRAANESQEAELHEAAKAVVNAAEDDRFFQDVVARHGGGRATTTAASYGGLPGGLPGGDFPGRYTGVMGGVMGGTVAEKRPSVSNLRERFQTGASKDESSEPLL